MAQNQPNVLLFSMARTPEREPQFNWIGPFASNDWVFYALKGAGITINALDDARLVKTIGVYNQDSKHEFLLAQKFTNLDPVTDNVQNLKKLLARRIDVLLNNDIGMRMQLAALGHSLDEVEALFVVKKFDLYAVLSKGTDQKTVDRWQRAFQELQKEGFVQEQQRVWLAGTAGK